MKYRHLFVLAATITSTAFGAMSAPGDGSSHSEDSTKLRTVLRSEIIASFRYYVHLNDELDRIEKLEGVDSPKALAVLKATSAYGGDDGKSAMEYNLQLFSIMLNANRKDSDLVGEFLQMFLVHHLRSANEDVSLLTAKLYSEHRDIFDKAIKNLPEDKQASVNKFMPYRSDGPNINDKRDQRTGIEAEGKAKNH